MALKNLFNPLLRFGIQKMGVQTVNNTAPDATGNVTIPVDTHVKLTEAEYAALTTEQKNNGSWYFTY